MGSQGPASAGLCVFMNMNEVKMRKLKDAIGIVLVIIFLVFLWGAYIGGFLLWILYVVFPDSWINPLSDLFYKIYPGLLEQYECVPDYMGGCD